MRRVFWHKDNLAQLTVQLGWGLSRSGLSNHAAKKNTSLRGGANADEVISWNINYISRDCFATRQLSLTLAMTYSNLLTIFSLRAVPSLIFQFFKIAFFKTKNFLSRRKRWIVAYKVANPKHKKQISKINKFSYRIM